jgi:hypothetical protein
VLVEDAPQDKATQMAVYRGEILVIGVKLRTEDGREQCCYGCHLKRAIKVARAQIGDFVEITRVGRRTITEGKVPMNLWEVRKLSSILA